jgi:hypothetical protein
MSHSVERADKYLPTFSHPSISPFSLHELIPPRSGTVVYRNRLQTKNDDDFSRIKVLYLVDSVK